VDRPTRSTITTLRRNLLAWYAAHRRRLPWRELPTPYRVWVSEIMLQQTRVEVVLPYFQRFMENFPTVQALARASEHDVLALWKGLGYYSRARNLHKAARHIVTQRSGQLPTSCNEWLLIPGIGRYTAGAIASISAGECVPIVDGNVKRILARIFAITAALEDSSTSADLWQLAETLVPQKNAGDFNQAMMELGAVICLPRTPHCPECPVRRSCKAHRDGLQQQLPARRKKKPVPHKNVVAAIIQQKGRYLMGKRPAEGMLGGLWEFPGGKVEQGETNEEALKRELMEECGVEIEVGEHLISVEHAYSHFSISLHVYHCRILSGEPHALQHTELKYLTKKQISEYPIPAADLKFLHLL